MQPPPINEPPTAPKKPSYSWLWILVGVLGVCGCGGVLLLAAVLFPVFRQARLSAQKTACMANVKQIASAQLMYASDNNDVFPAANSWIDQCRSYVKTDPWSCPTVLRQGKEYGYAMSASIAGKLDTSFAKPDTEPSVYETLDLVRNAAGDPRHSPTPNRHGKGGSMGFMDGHAKWMLDYSGQTASAAP